MSDNWTVQDAKAQLSEILRRARAGEPQRIGTKDGCIVVSARDWEAREQSPLGKWLVENAPRGEPMDLPSRRPDRGDPFEDEA